MNKELLKELNTKTNSTIYKYRFIDQSFDDITEVLQLIIDNLDLIGTKYLGSNIKDLYHLTFSLYLDDIMTKEQINCFDYIMQENFKFKYIEEDKRVILNTLLLKYKTIKN